MTTKYIVYHLSCIAPKLQAWIHAPTTKSWAVETWRGLDNVQTEYFYTEKEALECVEMKPIVYTTNGESAQ